jgi:hypothetical protein
MARAIIQSWPTEVRPPRRVQRPPSGIRTRVTALAATRVVQPAEQPAQVHAEEDHDHQCHGASGSAQSGYDTDDGASGNDKGQPAPTAIGEDDPERRGAHGSAGEPEPSASIPDTLCLRGSACGPG